MKKNEKGDWPLAGYNEGEVYTSNTPPLNLMESQLLNELHKLGARKYCAEKVARLGFEPRTSHLM
jgi:hypothetical protein